MAASRRLAWPAVALVVAASAGPVTQSDPCDLRLSPDLGWLQQYIEEGFFSDYRRLARRYYERNETGYAFLWLNSITYANLDFVREACPQAAQLALLLRAEERLPTRDAAAALLDFALGATGEAAAGWPIAEGLRRLRALAGLAAKPEEPSVDVVMPYCDEFLDGLLSKAVGYDEDWLPTRVPLRHVGLVLYRLKVCFPDGQARAAEGAAALALLPPKAAVAAASFRSVEVVPVDASPSAWEAARYLLHLANRYDRLADFTLFLHPDVFEHVSPRTLRNVLEALRVGTFAQSGLGPLGPRGQRWHEYLSLSHNYQTRPLRAKAPQENCTEAQLGFSDIWRAILGQGRAAEPGDFGFYCCSQFMVHRDRVHQRPREWYLQVAEGVPWEHCATSYMELLWHGIFNGGQLHEQKRQERTELPLFLRVDNFLETTADGRV